MGHKTSIGMHNRVKLKWDVMVSVHHGALNNLEKGFT